MTSIPTKTTGLPHADSVLDGHCTDRFSPYDIFELTFITTKSFIVVWHSSQSTRHLTNTEYSTVLVVQVSVS